jgi:hypothetical protein
VALSYVSIDVFSRLNSQLHSECDKVIVKHKIRIRTPQLLQNFSSRPTVVDKNACSITEFAEMCPSGFDITSNIIDVSQESGIE